MRRRLIIWIIGFCLATVGLGWLLVTLTRAAPVLMTIILSLLCGIWFIWIQKIGGEIAHDVFSHMHETDD